MKEKAFRGVTLTELLIGSSLILMLLALFTVVFVSSHRRFQLINAIYDTQNNALKGIDAIAGELSETDLSQIRLSQTTDNPPRFKFLYFPSARDDKGTYVPPVDRVPQWKHSFVYFLKKKKELLIEEDLYEIHTLEKIFTPPALTPPPEMTLAEALINNVIITKVVAQSIYSLTITNQGNTCHLSIGTCGIFRGKPIFFHMERTVYIENPPDAPLSTPPPPPVPPP